MRIFDFLPYLSQKSIQAWETCKVYFLGVRVKVSLSHENSNFYSDDCDVVKFDFLKAFNVV